VVDVGEVAEPTPDDPKVRGERRWPMALAVVTASVLTVLYPAQASLVPNWIFAVIEGVLLVVLVVADPGRIDRRAQWLRWLSIALVAVLMLTALTTTVVLVSQLIEGGAITNSASVLLRAGAIVWLTSNIAFSLLYWELDGGGAAERAHHRRQSPDLAFPQQLSPKVAPPGWRPRYVDHLYLSFTNATAFSPTDVMPLVPWAKVTMALQSTLSLLLLGLVIARAVNVLQ
jgi:uncharacterized membrane protein